MSEDITRNSPEDADVTSTRRDLLRTAGFLGGGFGFGSGIGGAASATAAAESGSAGYLYVSETGAAGDGRTDDAPAIQRAIDSIPSGEKRILVFEAGKRYHLGSTLEVSLQKIRGVAGNGAYLKVTGNYPALKVFGSFNSTASPEADANKSLARHEFGATVEDLTVHAPKEAYVGTGLRAVGTFGLSIVDCTFTGLATGITYAGRHRNGIVANNLVWDNRDYGIHFVDCDFHQLNVHGNHVSYSRKGVYSERTDLVNVQFVGNDVETSGSADGDVEALIHIDTSNGGSFVESAIVGNTIQGHQKVTYGVKIGNRYCYELLVANNVVRNTSGPLLSFDACSYVNVKGNTLVNGGTGLELLRYGGYFQIGGNQVNDVKQFLDVYVYGDLLPSVISNNTVRVTGGRAATVHSNRKVVDLRFVGNRIETTAANITPGADIVKIDSGRTMRGTLVTDNRFDVNSNPVSGLRVAAPTYNGTMVRDNIVLGANSDYDPLELPSDQSGNVVVKDNLAVE